MKSVHGIAPAVSQKCAAGSASGFLAGSDDGRREIDRAIVAAGVERRLGHIEAPLQSAWAGVGLF
jgi:hypothetical protein